MRFISDAAGDLRPVWMSAQEQEDPQALVSQFCRDYSIADCRFVLWHMLSASLSSHNKDDEPTAGEQIYFFENLMPFIEAAYLSQQEHEDKLSDDKMTVDADARAHKSSVSSPDEITASFEYIQAFFEAYSLSEFKTTLYQVLRAVGESRLYSVGCPANVFTFCQRFEAVINTSYLLLTGLTQIDAVPPTDSTIQQVNKINSNKSAHDNLGALRTFFEYKSPEEWKEELNRICLYALSKEPAQEWGVWVDSLTIYRISIDLVESLDLLLKEQFRSK